MSVRHATLLMRDNYEAVGFLPESALRRAEAEGRLWHQVDQGEWCGYLISGPLVYGRSARVWQECVDKSARRFGSGQRLYAAFEGACLRAGATSIRLRCAEDLEANVFWAAMGLHIFRVAAAHNRRRRQIHEYVKHLRHPSLIEFAAPPTVGRAE